MRSKSTDDLSQELMSACDLDAFLSENQADFQDKSIRDLLNQMLADHKITKAALAKKSGISEVYIHQILSGRRNPSRNRVICLAFGFSAGPDEAQEMLRRSGHAALYPRIRKDAIILYGLSRGMSLYEVNDRLFEADEETLL